MKRAPLLHPIEHDAQGGCGGIVSLFALCVFGWSLGLYLLFF